MKEELLELIKYRLKEADDSIKEAEVLLREGMSMRAVMNRLYYAMFYAVLALLQEKDICLNKSGHHLFLLLFHPVSSKNPTACVPLLPFNKNITYLP